jgi:PAS domain S-box-containing protein
MPEAKRSSEQSRLNQASLDNLEAPNRSLDLSDALLDTLKDAIVAVDRQGHILIANDAWTEFQQACSWLDHENGQMVIREEEFRQACTEANLILSGLRQVVEGTQPEFQHEFAMQHGGNPSWFRLTAKALTQKAENLIMVALRNVTPRRQTEEDLRETRALFHRITESTGDSFFMYDPQGHFLMHNASGADLLGKEMDSVIGKSIEEVFPPDQAKTVRAQNNLVLSTERTLGYEITLDTPNGKRVALVQKVIYRNHQNKPVGVIGIARDITERKQSEDKLKRREHHFRALIERSADVVTLSAADGTILYVSPASQEFCGFRSEELVGTNGFFWIHPEDALAAQKHFHDLCELPGSSFVGECRYLCKNGQWKWTEATATNRLDDPSVHAIVINSRDISERKKAEQTLRRFEAIVESSIDGIFSVDLEGEITSWNPAARKIFGGTEAERLGQDFRTLFPPNSLKAGGEFNAKILRGKGIENCETEYLNSDGRRVDLSLTFSPIFNPNHIHCGFAVIARDITERRRLEKEVLEISDYEKHRIGQDLHDDLCQHLVGISMIGNLLYVELVRNGSKQAEDAKQITDMIRTAVEHARILAKGLSPLNIAQGGIMAGLETLAANTEALFRIPCFFECTSPVHIEDAEIATQFYRIAQEALHNSVKHSQGTKAVIHLKTDKNAAVVTISDDGVGFPEFKKPGTGGGLGLHTMHYRARIIGATLSITQNVEGGTDVTCRLPLVG